jgi:hypothetical protein
MSRYRQSDHWSSEQFGRLPNGEAGLSSQDRRGLAHRRRCRCPRSRLLVEFAGTYEFIKVHRCDHSVQIMCRVLGVAASGYYEWLNRPMSNRAQEDARPASMIRTSFEASQGVYGARASSWICLKPERLAASIGSRG